MQHVLNMLLCAEPGGRQGSLPTAGGGPGNARGDGHNKAAAGRGSKKQVTKPRKMKRLFPDDEEVPHHIIAHLHLQAVLLNSLHNICSAAHPVYHAGRVRYLLHSMCSRM